MQTGSLPTSVTTYGRVVPSQKGRETLSAQVATRVSNVEVREGEKVSKGAPLMTLVPSPETRANYKQAEQALKVARHLLARSRQLAAAHLETAAQLAQDEKTEADAKAALEALREEGANGPNTLKAPFDAVIMSIFAGSGSYLARGAPVIELARPAGLVFRTGVVPAQAAGIKNGDEATITPFSGSGTFHGKVILRGSVVSTVNGLIPIEISLPDNLLLTGEMGKVVINTGVR
ncbi:MAG: HlyD family efflux transporter periplasmic adaptor subunit [Gammaproteobacteria bacterium]